MGFKARRTYVLAFGEGTPLHGAEVKCRGLAGGKILKWKAEVEAVPQEDMIDMMVNQLAKVISSWDLEEDDGVPMQHDAYGIGELEMDQIMCLYDAWLNAVMGVSRSLGKGFSSGESLQEDSTTSRDDVSPDLLSLLTQSSSSTSSNDSTDIPIPV